MQGADSGPYGNPELPGGNQQTADDAVARVKTSAKSNSGVDHFVADGSGPALPTNKYIHAENQESSAYHSPMCVAAPISSSLEPRVADVALLTAGLTPSGQATLYASGRSPSQYSPVGHLNAPLQSSTSSVTSTSSEPNISVNSSNSNSYSAVHLHSSKPSTSGLNDRGSGYGHVDLNNPIRRRTIPAMVHASPKSVVQVRASQLSSSLQSSQCEQICETCREFWAVNFVDCPAPLGKISLTPSKNGENASLTLKADSVGAVPKTFVVIQALIREYTNRGLQLPEPVQGVLQFVDALSCALDPVGCGRVYPQFYFAMCATFGPFDMMISKLTATLFFRPPSIGNHQDRLNKLQQPIQWFHGYASRNDVRRIIKNRMKSLSDKGHHSSIGMYALRFSANKPGYLALSWMKPSSKREGRAECVHTLIQNAGQGFQCVVKESGADADIQTDKTGSLRNKSSSSGRGRIFSTIAQLLSHHCSRFKECVPVETSPNYLRFPDIEEDWLLKRADIMGSRSTTTYLDDNSYDSAGVYGAAEGHLSICASDEHEEPNDHSKGQARQSSELQTQQGHGGDNLGAYGPYGAAPTIPTI